MARKQIKREAPARETGLSSTLDNITVSPDQSHPGIPIDLSADESQSTLSNGASQGASSSEPPLAPSQGLEVLGRGVKELVQAIQNLRHLGVEDLVLPLPKIVVVGDQSTGKSSLIEGISEIKVPRKSGVCTRCPLEINLSENTHQDDPWGCVVSLCKKYIYDGNEGRATGSRTAGATRKRPLGPWILQEAEDFVFAQTSRKDDVASLLEWAQIATLNPSSAFDEYIPGSTTFKGNPKCQLKFSPNVVRLEITGPDLPNLAFYDLPGVINVSDVPEEAYLVELVKNLVKQYIKADSCINLLALPMTDDPANSSASRLIRDEGAQSRTVGVLTKPDRVQDVESIEQWVQILAGQRFELGHGYYIVKNNPDATVEHATARAQERDFFANNQPWSTNLRPYGHRFGTLQLQTFLSQILTTQIRASLPRIAQQVQEKLAQTANRLNELPKAPAGNLPMKILEKVLMFESRIRKHFDGGSSEYTLPKQWYNLAEDFRSLLADSRPMLTQPPLIANARASIDSFSPGTPTPAKRTNNGGVPDAIAIDSETDDDVPRKPTPMPIRSEKKRTSGDNPQETPTKRIRMSDIPPFTPSTGANKKSFSKNFSLADVRNILQGAHIREHMGLPNQIDPKATQLMVKESVKVWDVPTYKFLETTVALCRAVIFEEIHQTFAEWKNTLFHHRTVEICESFLDRAMMEQRGLVARLLKNEEHMPMTFNVEAISTASEKALAMMQARRHYHRASKYLDEQDSNVDRTPSRHSKADRLAKVTADQIGPDPYSQEVLAVSHVKGYYECAFSRFVDNVCQTISCDLFTKCRDELGGVLKQDLGISEADAHDHCALLLAIKPEDERERRQLTKEQSKLHQAQESLEGLNETAK